MKKKGSTHIDKLLIVFEKVDEDINSENTSKNTF